jgi:amidase
MEFLGTPWSEGLLVEIGYGYEQATQHRCAPPTTPPLGAAADGASAVYFD